MIYRLSIWRNNEEHIRYEFFGSLADVKRRCAELVRDYGYDRKMIVVDHCKPTPKGKKQMLALLNEWASHSDTY